MFKNRTISASSRALMAIFLAALLSGAISPATKIVVRTIPPLSYTLIRFILALSCMIIVVKKIPKINKKNLPVFALSLLATANVVLFPYGVKRPPATIAQTLYAGVPIIAAILSAKLLKENIPIRKKAGIVIGFIGVVMIILLPLIGKPSVFKGEIIGNLIILTAVTSYAVYTVLSKFFQNHYTPGELTIYFFFTTAFIQLLIAPVELLTYPGWLQKLSL